MTTVDQLDVQLLTMLDDDPDISTLALARALGVARNTVQGRLGRLAATALGPFDRRVEPAALGYGLTAFVSLWISQSTGIGIAARLAAIAQVVEVHATTGDADLLVKVAASDTDDLRRTMRAILALEGVDRTSTAISLATEVSARTRPLLELVRKRGSYGPTR